MRKHVKTYMEHFGYGEQDVIMCEACGINRCVDVHHLVFRSHGGTDDIENLIGLCRKCHEDAHNNPAFNRKLKLKHNESIDSM